MATLTVTPTQTFISGDTVLPATLNQLAQSTVALTAGSIVAADIASDAVTDVKIASGVDASKLTTGTLPIARIADAAVTPAKLADSAVTTAKINNAAVTAAKLNGAQTGSAPIYGCRAWVNFDGTTADNIGGTYSRAGTTVTVDTTVAHGLKVGHDVFLDFTSGAAAAGTFTVVTAPTTTQFTVTHGTSGTTSGNVTLNRRLIRASGNVANVSYLGTGSYSVNFTEAMSDANYAALATIESFTSGSVGGAVNQAGLTAISARLVAYSPTFSGINAPAFHLAIFR
jgi:hypothetical protein